MADLVAERVNRFPHRQVRGPDVGCLIFNRRQQKWCFAARVHAGPQAKALRGLAVDLTDVIRHLDRCIAKATLDVDHMLERVGLNLAKRHGLGDLTAARHG